MKVRGKFLYQEMFLPEENAVRKRCLFKPLFSVCPEIYIEHELSSHPSKIREDTIECPIHK